MTSSPLLDYIAQTPSGRFDAGTAAYLANLGATAQVAPQLARAIVQELADQRSHLKLIASEAELVTAEGKPAMRSKAKFTVKPEAETEARTRLDALLARFPVYPGLDLAVLQRHFP